MERYEYTGDLLPSGAPIEDIASSAGEGFLADVPRFKGGKKGSLFRYESPEQWGGAPVSARAGDVSLRVFDREKRRPVGEGVTVHFAARGASWSHTSQTDSEGFAYAEDAPSVPIEATIEYGSRPTVLLHPSLTQTGRFRSVMAGGSMDMIMLKGWDIGVARSKVQVLDRLSKKPISGLKVWFLDRKSRWNLKRVTDSEGYVTVEGVPAHGQIWMGAIHNGRRFLRRLHLMPGVRRGQKDRHPGAYPPITIGDTMVVNSRYMGITPEAADLYPLVNGNERATMEMGITPESAFLYPLVNDRGGTRVGAIGNYSMRGRYLGQQGMSYVRLQVIDRNGNAIEGVRVLVTGIGEKRTDVNGVATIEVPGINPGKDVIAFVALPEDTANPKQVDMKTSTLTSTPLIVRSSSAAGTSFITAAEGIGAVLGLGLMVAGSFAEKEANARPILFSVGGSVGAAAVFSVLSRNVR